MDSPNPTPDPVRLRYLLTEAVPLTAFVLMGVPFWALGAPTRSAGSAVLVDEGDGQTERE